MADQIVDNESSDTVDTHFGDVGCALLGGSVVAALLIGVAIPFLLIPVLWVFVLAITILVGCIVGMPLFFLAVRFKRANVWSAALGGLVTGITVPAVFALQGDGVAWHEAAPFGIAGAIGGLVFWCLLLGRPVDKWD